MLAKCRKCKKQFENHLYWADYFMTCPNCSDKTPRPKTNPKLWHFPGESLGGGIPGYNSPGYNEGLGKVIRNKKQYYEECNKLNITPTG